jgi:hypothetical protein
LDVVRDEGKGRIRIGANGYISNTKSPALVRFIIVPSMHSVERKCSGNGDIETTYGGRGVLSSDVIS